MGADDTIEGRTFDEIRIGDQASLSRTVNNDDIALCAAVSGNLDPAGVDLPSLVNTTAVPATAFVATVLATRLPGPGTDWLAQSLTFHKQIAAGDTLTTKLIVKKKIADARLVVMDCECTDQSGATVISGQVEVRPPSQKFVARRAERPEIKLRRHEKYDRLIDRSRGFPPVITAVAYPCDASSLAGVIDAARAGIIRPILIGPLALIRATADQLPSDLAGLELVDAPNSRAAADKAVELVRTGKAELLMKGSLHTDEIMGAVVRREAGMRTARRISHCFIMDVPSYPKPLVITDAAVNIAPTLEDKIDIVRNAIDMVRALGLESPRVAILSAVETVNPKIQSTIDAAALCKMADRGQITGGILDGPLALDNAISMAAARTKGIESSVAGQADILVVPDLEAGNMLAKNLSFLADADSAGIVLGARVPIILTSRADSVRARMASCAVAALCVHGRGNALSQAAE
jgi:phosphotransacetylase/acyl dehydratase